ncbi:MAG: ABC transporter permease [Bacillota bacterium]|nr:ABC transporter permease [Bacillota bacterium]
MRTYIIRRFLLVIPTLFIMSSTLFVVYRMIPGDVVDEMVQRAQNQQGFVEKDFDIGMMRRALGLDVPIHIQYFNWWRELVTKGDLGKSLISNRTLVQEMRDRLPVTLELALLGVFFGTLVNTPIGILAAVRQDTKLDYILRVASMIMAGIPGFWVMTMVFVYPSIWWGWTPDVVYIPLVRDPIANLRQFIFPAFLGSLAAFGGGMRFSRAMMLEVLRQDYIRTAWSKGLRERWIVIRHAIKPTLIPVITGVGMMIPGLFGGSVITEQIFGLPGMGRLLVSSAISRDYPIVVGYNLLMSTMVMVFIVFTDIAYAYVDPRIRYR